MAARSTIVLSLIELRGKFVNNLFSRRAVRRVGVPLCAIVAAAAGTAALAMPAQAAEAKPATWSKTLAVTDVNGKLMVHPDNDNGCTGGNLQSNMEACIYIQGSGLTVTWIHGIGTATDDGETFDVFIFNQANSAHHFADTGYGYEAQGGSREADWTPKATEPAGNYCVGVQVQGAGGFLQECQPVSGG